MEPARLGDYKQRKLTKGQKKSLRKKRSKKQYKKQKLAPILAGRDLLAEVNVRPRPPGHWA